MVLLQDCSESRIESGFDLNGLLAFVRVKVGEVFSRGESVLGTAGFDSLLGFVDIGLSDLGVSVVGPHGVRTQMVSCSMHLLDFHPRSWLVSKIPFSIKREKLNNGKS